MASPPPARPGSSFGHGRRQRQPPLRFRRDDESPSPPRPPRRRQRMEANPPPRARPSTTRQGKQPAAASTVRHDEHGRPKLHRHMPYELKARAAPVCTLSCPPDGLFFSALSSGAHCRRRLRARDRPRTRAHIVAAQRRDSTRSVMRLCLPHRPEERQARHRRAAGAMRRGRAPLPRIWRWAAGACESRRLRVSTWV